MSTQPEFIVPVFTLSDRLRKAREVAGLKQATMAKEIGISHRSVTSYESGATVPRLIVLKAWAMRCGVPLQWLETGEAPSPDGDGASVECTPRDSNPEPADYRSRARVSPLTLAA